MDLFLTPYERKVRQEIDKWINEKEGILSKALELIGVPFEFMYNKIPKHYQQTINGAVLGFMELLRDASYWTYSNKTILQKAKSLGIEIDDINQLNNYELEKLDKIARQFFMQNKIAAALEGAGCGLGGLFLIAADIPLLFGIAFRLIQQIGSSYGFDMEDPDMLPIILSVFNAGTASSTAGKTATLIDMRIAAVALSKKWSYKRIAEKTYTGTIINILKARTKNLPKDIANNVTKRKLAQLVPVVGLAIGAGFNYWFISSVCRSAYIIFRDMYLANKYNDKKADK